MMAKCSIWSIKLVFKVLHNVSKVWLMPIHFRGRIDAVLCPAKWCIQDNQTAFRIGGICMSWYRIVYKFRLNFSTRLIEVLSYWFNWRAGCLVVWRGHNNRLEFVFDEGPKCMKCLCLRWSRWQEPPSATEHAQFKRPYTRRTETGSGTKREICW